MKESPGPKRAPNGEDAAAVARLREARDSFGRRSPR